MPEIRFKNADSIGQAYIISAASCQIAYRSALQIAQAAVCQSDGCVPCGRCAACRKAAEGKHPDVITINRQLDDKGRVKNVVAVEQVREASSDATILPNEAPRKVYIFREAAYMNIPAQNAALKFLEEPPNGAVILLCVINSEQLLPTVRSRCTEITVSESYDENGKPPLETVTPGKSLSVKADAGNADFRKADAGKAGSGRRKAGKKDAGQDSNNNDDAENDSALAAIAAEYVKTVAAGNQFALWKFCEGHNDLSIRELEAVCLAIMQLLTDMLCRRTDAHGLSDDHLLRLSALIGRCLDYLKVNVNVKQIFGLLETDSI